MNKQEEITMVEPIKFDKEQVKMEVIELPETENTDRYFSVASAAKFLDMHPNTIRNFIKNGMLRAFQIGDAEKLYVLQSELMALIKPVEKLQSKRWKGKPVYD